MFTVGTHLAEDGFQAANATLPQADAAQELRRLAQELATKPSADRRRTLAQAIARAAQALAVPVEAGDERAAELLRFGRRVLADAGALAAAPADKNKSVRLAIGLSALLREHQRLAQAVVDQPLVTVGVTLAPSIKLARQRREAPVAALPAEVIRAVDAAAASLAFDLPRPEEPVAAAAEADARLLQSWVQVQRARDAFEREPGSDADAIKRTSKSINLQERALASAWRARLAAALGQDVGELSASVQRSLTSASRVLPKRLAVLHPAVPAVRLQAGDIAPDVARTAWLQAARAWAARAGQASEVQPLVVKPITEVSAAAYLCRWLQLGGALELRDATVSYHSDGKMLVAVEPVRGIVAARAVDVGVESIADTLAVLRTEVRRQLELRPPVAEGADVRASVAREMMPDAIVISEPADAVPRYPAGKFELMSVETVESIVRGLPPIGAGAITEGLAALFPASVVAVSRAQDKTRWIVSTSDGAEVPRGRVEALARHLRTLLGIRRMHREHGDPDSHSRLAFAMLAPSQAESPKLTVAQRQQVARDVLDALAVPDVEDHDLQHLRPLHAVAGRQIGDVAVLRQGRWQTIALEAA